MSSPTTRQVTTSPASDASAVTPSDTADLPLGLTRGIYVGGAGNLAVKMYSGTVLTFNGVPAGQILQIQVSRVMVTNTTATNIVALY